MYEDRQDAGRRLADAVAALGLTAPVVIALPRGGVPVAQPVAARLGALLDLVLVRKIGVPGQPEYAAGAIVDGPPEHVFLNDRVIEALRIPRRELDAVIARKRSELAERRQLWLCGRAPVDLAGREAVVVDDGIATGATVRAALMALRERGPARIILAVPVAARDSLEDLRPLVDEVICPLVPEPFRAVGLHYRDFAQVSDEAVAEAMRTDTT